MSTQSSKTWIGTFRGEVVDPVNPLPEQFTIDAIALGLSRINRFAGQTDEPYSVAQHSVRVSEIVGRKHPKLALCALLHDASEFVTSDVPRPVKRRCPELLAIEERVMHAIAERFGFPWPMPAEVREVDDRMLATEKKLLQPNSPAWDDYHAEPYPDETCLYQSWERAAGLFLRRFYDITGPQPLTEFCQE